MTSNAAHWPYPIRIAHRGAGKQAPENTLAAMRLGFEYGFSMMEYDVKLSADLHAILLHDDDLDRTTNGQGSASLLSLSYLALLDAGGWHSARYAGEPVPTLQAIARYTQANGIASNIEIKPSRRQETLTGHHVAILARDLWMGISPAPLLSSFSIEALQAAMRAAPELPRGLLIDHALTGEDLEQARRLKCVSIHMKNACTDHAHIQAVLTAGLKAVIWTVNDADRAQQLVNWGCSGIVTDNILDIPASCFDHS
jgi:glycerophosphoryl diester phosphodiesterase